MTSTAPSTRRLERSTPSETAIRRPTTELLVKRQLSGAKPPSRRSSMPRFAAGAPYLWPVPIYGYARVSTDGQTLDAQIAPLKAAGAEKVFREKVSGARADRPELARLMRTLTSGDVVLVTRLDRLDVA